MDQSNNVWERKPSQSSIGSTNVDKDLVKLDYERDHETISLAQQERKERIFGRIVGEQNKLSEDGGSIHNGVRHTPVDERVEKIHDGTAACRRRSMVSIPKSLDLKRTEQQLLGSRSNYEILQSGNQSYQDFSFPPSLLASVDNKRIQHQREERFRRNRLKHALETLADILPHKLGSLATPGKACSKNISKIEIVENAIDYIRELHERYSIDTDVQMGALEVRSYGGGQDRIGETQRAT